MGWIKRDAVAARDVLEDLVIGSSNRTSESDRLGITCELSRLSEPVDSPAVAFFRSLNR